MDQRRRRICLIEYLLDEYRTVQRADDSCDTDGTSDAGSTSDADDARSTGSAPATQPAQSAQTAQSLHLPRIPDSDDEQRLLLRALLNIRRPAPVDARFLRVQDEYLQSELKSHTITDAMAVPPALTVRTETGSDVELAVWQGDITMLRCDAIMNAANSGLTGCYVPNHRCIDNAIHSTAGIQLRLACDEIMERQQHPEPVGQAKITPAFNLPAQYVLHTVGPMIPSGEPTVQEQEQLADCYRSCLQLAARHHLASVAFCCISTGEFRFPADLAARIAVRTVEEFLHAPNAETHSPTPSPSPMPIRKVIFDVFSDQDRQRYERILANRA